MYKAIKAKCPLPMIRTLLVAGSDLTIVSTGNRNAFHYAVKAEKVDTIQVLLNYLAIEAKADLIPSLLA